MVPVLSPWGGPQRVLRGRYRTTGSHFPVRSIWRLNDRFPLDSRLFAVFSTVPKEDLRSTSGSFAVRFGILLAPLAWADGAVGGCRLRSHRADGSRHARSAVAAAGVFHSRQTVSAAHSSSAPSVQTSGRFRQGCADAARPARAA